MTTASIEMPAFSALIQDARRAFSIDPSYFETMFISVFRSKSRVVKGTLRKELRVAEYGARKQCVASDVRACYNVSPCGTGGCPFAVGDLATLRISDQPGKVSRPHRKARISVGATEYSVSLNAEVYESSSNATFKLVRNADNTWRIYKPEGIKNMVASPKYEQMIATGSLVLALDSPNGIAPKLDSFVETYDIENAIEPLMKLRGISI